MNLMAFQAGVVPVSLSGQDSNAATAAAVVSSLDPNLIQQIQQILMKTDDGPVVSAVAALSLQQHTHTLPTLPQTHSIPPPTVSVPQPQVTAGPPPLPSAPDAKPGMIPRLTQSG